MTDANAKKVKPIAAVLKSVGLFQSRLDTQAESMFAALDGGKIRTLEAFNEVIAEAYKINGWHAGSGRPAADVTTKPVPRTVRTYVWEFRAAFKLGVKVWTLKTLYELRQEVDRTRARARPAATAANESVHDPQLKGLTVRQDDKLTGSIFHDAAVVYDHLDESGKASFAAQLNKLLTRYQRQVAGTLKLVA